MSQEWINKTCQTCKFQKDGLCRVAPPSVPTHKGFAYLDILLYEYISKNGGNWMPCGYSLACSKYKELK